MGVIVDGLDLSLRQFSAAWRVMCNPAPGRIIEVDDGIEYVFSGIPIPFFNVCPADGTQPVAAAPRGSCARGMCVRRQDGGYNRPA